MGDADDRFVIWVRASRPTVVPHTLEDDYIGPVLCYPSSRDTVIFLGPFNSVAATYGARVLWRRSVHYGDLRRVTTELVFALIPAVGGA